MKILVFGSNGLVGNSLKRNLSNNDKYECIFSTRADTDLFSFKETKETIKNFMPDLIINAAAKVGGIYANDTQGTQFLLDNLKININILESLIEYKSIKLINLGSSCIYPLNAENPIGEKSFMNGALEPTNSPYAMAKLTGIELGKTLNKDFGHKIINLMPTNLYGPNDNFDGLNSHVIPGLIFRMYKAKENGDDEFSIWGTGKPLREFLYVDDLSEAIIFIHENDIEEDLINVGSGIEISISSLANQIKNVIGFDGKLNFDSNMPDGNPRKLLDSSLINNLGWKAKTTLEDGLNLTYNWFKKNI